MTQTSTPPTRALSGTELRHQNDVVGLTHIHNFGMIRPQELGYLMWPHYDVDGVLQPTKRNGFPQACRITKSWRERGLIIERTLPGGRGRALVLSQAGAAFLTAEATRTGIPLAFPARSGKDIGDMVGGVWVPPASWKHDLMSHGVLARLVQVGYEIWPENQIRRDGRWTGKIPDGVVRTPEGAVIWIETECAEKSGAALAAVAATCIAARAGTLPPVLGMDPDYCAVIYNVAARDSSGNRLDHRQRVSTAIQLQCKAPVMVAWWMCKLENFGVKALRLHSTIVNPDPGLRVLQVLNAHGWRAVEGAKGVLEIGYGAHRGQVGVDADGNAFFGVDGGERKPAANLTSAKKGLAEAFAVLTRLR